MCGITGAYSFKGSINPDCIKRMTDSLRHRGPDDEGFLAVDSTSGKVVSLTGIESKTNGPRIGEFNRSANLFLGHRRLSIIDLSPLGHQPMSNEDGTLWIVHNGEVYNFIEIRNILEPLGHHFKSRTDTEVILHAYEEWGVDCLIRFNGMWAFAILDLKKKTLFCSRDRAGVKPFYYLYDGKRFCFASEIKALLQIDDFCVESNEQIMADYIFSGLLDHTHETFFKNIHQLKPGEYLIAESNGLTIKSYWDIEVKEVHYPRKEDYAECFYELLEDSIRLRLRTDVPIGTCLSGGLDSSSIVCLANKLLFEINHIDPRLVGEKQKTFSSCFEDPVYDERRFIELVIRQTGAEKNYVFPTGQEFLNDLDQLIWYQEEPFGSSSMYAQWEVMKLARDRQVTVLLDGQGGDELLAGYLPSFYHLFRQARKVFDIGLLMREGKGFLKHHRSLLPRVFAAMAPKTLRTHFPELAQDSNEWAEEGFKKNYYRNISWPRKFEHELSNYLYHAFRFTVLPGLLHYEDRNSMAFSLEARLPFLDYRLVEFSFSLPARLKMDGGVTKVVLREAMKGTLPERVRNRMDKIGFVTPEADWFKTTLRDPIREIFNSKSFSERGIFNIAHVHKAFQDHCNGKVDHHSMIWRCVNLELWLRTFIDKNQSSQSWRNSGN